jgi:hypothetical protein
MLRHRAADLLGLPPTNLDRFITSARFGNPPSFALVLGDALLKCGTNNPSANNFCAKCGTALTNSAQNAKPKTLRHPTSVASAALHSQMEQAQQP